MSHLFWTSLQQTPWNRHACLCLTTCLSLISNARGDRHAAPCWFETHPTATLCAQIMEMNQVLASYMGGMEYALLDHTYL